MVGASSPWIDEQQLSEAVKKEASVANRMVCERLNDLQSAMRESLERQTTQWMLAERRVASVKNKRRAEQVLHVLPSRTRCRLRAE